MELILIRLSGPHRAARTAPNAAAVADIVWAVAPVEAGLEHVTARPGPLPGTIDLALFLSTGGAHPARTALGLCDRAVGTAPVLSGWTAAMLAPGCPPTER